MGQKTRQTAWERGRSVAKCVSEHWVTLMLKLSTSKVSPRGWWGVWGWTDEDDGCWEGKFKGEEWGRKWTPARRVQTQVRQLGKRDEGTICGIGKIRFRMYGTFIQVCGQKNKWNTYPGGSDYHWLMFGRAGPGSQERTLIMSVMAAQNESPSVTLKAFFCPTIRARTVST